MSLKWMLLLLALIVGRAGDCFCVTALEANCPMEHGLTSRRSR